jgi:RNA recognition motif-containing protein
LSYGEPDETVRGALEPFGEATSARVIKDKDSGQSRDFGFVGMPCSPRLKRPLTALRHPQRISTLMKLNHVSTFSGKGQSVILNGLFALDKQLLS